MPEAAGIAPTHIEAAVRRIVQQRGPDASACPSDVARALSPGQWRELMPQVRAVASQMAQQGEIEISQRGRAVSPVGPWKGPIRLRIPRAD
jgi:hypothetical protein